MKTAARINRKLGRFFPQYSSFLLCLSTLFADDYLVYYKHYHNIAVSCTKTGIKHDKNNNNKNRRKRRKEKKRKKKTNLAGLHFLREKKSNLFRLRLNESREGFCRRGRGRSRSSSSSSSLIPSLISFLLFLPLSQPCLSFFLYPTLSFPPFFGSRFVPVFVQLTAIL